MTDRELMQQALEALESDPVPLNAISNARAFLSAALAQPEPDGLSWLKKDSNYFSQPKRKPLTENELFKLWVSVPAETEDRFAFARAIEAAHGIKGENT